MNREWRKCTSRLGSLRIAVIPDLDKPIERLFLHLTAAEREQANALPTERRIRQYVIGRLAARKAIQELLETRLSASAIEILSESDNAPFAIMNGVMDQVAISISHSSRLAIACAWLTHSRNLVSAGIDLERLRPNEVADSKYAFSLRERRLFERAPEGAEISALAAWTVKEAVWKALLAGQAIGPDAIEVRGQSLANGHAEVKVKGELSKRLGDSKLQVRTKQIEGPDGAYVYSVSQVMPSGSIWAGEK